MICPNCNNEKTKVRDSRLLKSGDRWRRRQCLICYEIFTTYETIYECGHNILFSSLLLENKILWLK